GAILATSNILSSGASSGFGAYDRSGGSNTNISYFYRSGNITHLYDNTASDVLNYNTAGNVGIGINPTAFKFDVNGSANATQYCIAGANCISAWPSGGGSGTVNSGSLNQVAYYSTNPTGNTVSGASALSANNSSA